MSKAEDDRIQAMMAEDAKARAAFRAGVFSNLDNAHQNKAAIIGASPDEIAADMMDMCSGYDGTEPGFNPELPEDVRRLTLAVQEWLDRQPETPVV